MWGNIWRCVSVCLECAEHDGIYVHIFAKVLWMCCSACVKSTEYSEVCWCVMWFVEVKVTRGNACSVKQQKDLHTCRMLHKFRFTWLEQAHPHHCRWVYPPLFKNLKYACVCMSDKMAYHYIIFMCNDNHNHTLITQHKVVINHTPIMVYPHW